MRTTLSRTAVAVASLALFAGVATACGGDDSDANDAAATTAATSATGSGAGASTDACGFDQALIDAAKKEGQVNGVGSTREEDTAIISGLFKDAYGISVAYHRQPTADATQQIETSLEAGAVTMDFIWNAEPSAFVGWTEEDIIVELDPPNVDEYLPNLLDPTRRSLPVFTNPMGVLYSTARIDADELPDSWAKLVETRGDKVIAMANPSNSGSGLVYHYVLGEEIGPDYLTSFEGKKNHVTESGATLTQLVLTGEADYGLPGYESEVVKAKKNGEPLDLFYLDEVVPTSTSDVAVLKAAPHPNAGKLFAEFLICETVQSKLWEMGFRPVIEGARAPEGLSDLADQNVVTPDLPDMIAKRQEVTARFDAATT